MSHLIEDRNPLTDKFIGYVQQLIQPRVLEMGTFRSKPERGTIHREWFPNAASYKGTDFQEGVDVDIVADAHELSHFITPGSIDAIVSVAVFEHLRKPWIVANEMVRLLAPGGALYVETHQSFPLHGFPSDYWRFSREAMEVLFTPEMGLKNIETCYNFPCQVVSERDPGGKDHPAYLNVVLFAIKKF